MDTTTPATLEALPTLLQQLAETHGLVAVRAAIASFTDTVPKNGKYVLHSGGIRDQQRVMKYLSTLGTVTEATEHEDRRLDIDCWFNGEAVSIKAQHAGLQYNNICMELATFHHNQPWEPSDLLAFQRAVTTMAAVKRYQTRGAAPSWYYTGTATVYAILQGSRLRLYRKTAIQQYEQQHNFLRVCGLSVALLRSQSGVNSFCGYLCADSVPFEAEYQLDSIN